MSAGTAQRGMELALELSEHDRWSRAELAEHQRAALRAIVRHAVSRSPYYREALGPAALRGDVSLDELPTLPKATLMQEWDRVVTDPRLRLRDVERHIADGEPGAPFLGEYRITVTGGSTGRRGVFVASRDEFELAMAGMFRALVLARFGPEMRLAGVGSPDPLHLSNQVFAEFHRERSASPRVDVSTPLEQVVARLNAYRPAVILTYPTILGLLAQEQLDGRLRIELEGAATSSEALGDDVRERAAAAWPGLRLHDVYASTEGGMMATECDGRCGLHVWEDCVILEVVDERNRPVPPGVPGHRVLLTSLWNRTQPLIRYELEDSVTMAVGENPTGRPFARIARVGGRTADILRFPARAGGTVAVHPVRLRDVFVGRSTVVQYQLRHDAERLRVSVVLTSSASRETPDEVRLALAEALAAAGAAPVRIDVEPVREIARVGAGAKATFVAAS